MVSVDIIAENHETSIYLYFNFHFSESCEAITSPQKRKANSEAGGPNQKQQKTFNPAYFIPELAHVVALCYEKLPFVSLAQELTKRRIPHCGVQVEANASSMVLKLLTLPQPEVVQPEPSTQQPSHEPKAVRTPVIDKDVWNALMKRLLSVSIRAQCNKNVQMWTVELVFFGTPLPSTHHKEQGQRRAVYLQYEMLPTQNVEKTVDLLLKDWSKIVYLYTLVHDFKEQYNNEKFNLQNAMTIKSYSYTNLLIAYGNKKDVNLSIYWCTEAKMFKMVSWRII
jgi:mediator of RNA polymerase II transcription subunit 14